MARLPKIEVRRLPEAQGLPLPEYQTDGAAGCDLLAAIDADDELVLAPGEHALVPTGLELAIPPGYEGQVRPRSGLALNRGVTVLNTPGTIDSDYRGEVKVILINHSREPFTILRGDKIAQMVIAKVTQVRWEETDELLETERGAGGFGSTGL